MLSSLKDLSFTFMLSQFTYFSPPQEANTCVNCVLIPTYLHIALVILLYVDNYPWDIHVISWKQPLKLNLPLCCFNTFTLKLLLYELTLMQDLLMLVLKYYSWKVFALWFICLLMSFTIVLIAAFITCAYNSMIKIMMACHSRNYLCYCLPTRDE